MNQSIKNTSPQVEAHPRVRDPLHARSALNIALPNALVSGAAPETVVLALSAVRHLKLADRPYMTKIFQLLAKKARKTLEVMSFKDMLGCLDHFAALSVRGFAYPRFFLMVLDHLYETWHKANPQPEEIVSFIKSYAKAGVRSDKMNKLFAYIASPQVSGEDTTWTSEQALSVARAMVFYKFYTKDAIQAMLSVASQDPNILDDPHLLRSVKVIELCLRLELHAIQATLKPELIEFLEVLREAPYHDPSLESDTSLTYQLRGFLKKHGGEITRQMVGPWPVHLADMERRAAFMCIENHMYYPSTDTLRAAPALCLSHLESLGWNVVKVSVRDWDACETYDDKAAFVKNLLVKHHLLKITKVPELEAE